MRLRWAPAAAADLEHIGTYLLEHNSSLAESTVRRVYDAAQSLGRFPNRGRLGREAGTRELLITSLPYFIVYKVEADVVAIVRVLHGAQQYPLSKAE
jgi:toxin ParE1/3/4